MGLFDDTLGESKSTPVTKEMAFLGILMAADFSDGNVSEDEVRQFGGTIVRMKLYKDMAEGQVNRLIDRAAGIIKRSGVTAALEKFAAALPENLHRPVFANACNQILADGVVEDEEKEFINNLRKALNLPEGAAIDYKDPAVGKALFNLGLGNNAATGDHSGAYSCARCHTKGASIQNGTEEPAGVDLSDYKGFPDGSGALGFSLRYPIVPRQFLTVQALADFIKKGSVNEQLYGQRGQGSGRMPGFGDNPNTLEDQSDGMFSEDMVDAVAVYEANLHLDGQGNDLPGGPETKPFTYADATTTSTMATTTTTGKG